MKMRAMTYKHTFFIGAAALILAACSIEREATTDIEVAEQPVEQSKIVYSPDEASLSQHQASPDWFRDAKFGIYFHWGPYSVAADTNEWYPRWMHFNLSEEDWDGLKPGYHIDRAERHEEIFGKPPSKFGYHDMIPLFTGEKFDAAEWASLFERSGAEFAGPVGMHHDGFAMWDSEVTPWNAADKGPKVDITGELFAELRKRDIKTIISFHHARLLQRYRGLNFEQAREKYGSNDVYHVYWNSHYPWIEGLAPTSDDPELRLLYGNVPEEEWLDTFWLGTLKEVIDKYQPDIIWFDTWLDQIPEETRYEFVSYYFNQAETWDKDVMITHKHDDMPTSFSLLDLEKGKRDELTDEPWMTDDTVSTGSWSYTENLEIKTPEWVLHDFIDIVSKNGQLLLNISPKADGTIPDNQLAILEGLGAWLGVNGEAIYGTRPWTIYGEGPTEFDPNGMNIDGHFVGRMIYTAADIRFTAKDDKLYAITLDMPSDQIVISSLAEGSNLYPGEIAMVESLNGNFVRSWSRDESGVTISLSADAPKQDAYAFRISPK